MNHPIAVCSPLVFININNFKTAVWYLDWFSGCWWFWCHAVRWWNPVCWEGNRNLVPENVVDNVIDSRCEKIIALCNNDTLNKVIMLFMYQVDWYTVLLWWLYECLGEDGMGHDHQLAGINVLWLAWLNIGWRMPLSQYIQCIHIWPLTVPSPGTISQHSRQTFACFRVVYGSGRNGMCPNWFETVSEMCDNIYIYIYAKAVKATWERIKAYWVHIYFHWVEQLIGNNQWLKILISELEYVDLWITCELIHCFTGGSHCPGWCGPEVHPSLPGSKMPVLRILTMDEKFGLGYSDAWNIKKTW